MAGAGERIGRVRVTSGANTITANGSVGNATDDVVVMDDFLYAEPLGPTANPVPEPTGAALVALALACAARARSRRSS